MGDMFFELGDFPNAQKNFNLTIASITEDSKFSSKNIELARAYTGLGKIASRFGDDYRAESLINTAADQCEKDSGIS